MGAKVQLAKLAGVELRTIWPDEARNLTPWLASEEGLQLLSDTLGLPVRLIRTEMAVGPFCADLVLQSESDPDHKVVVENQFGRTDHDHLGKLLTYAAGLGARTLVWVAERFTDEHRETLDWLNEQAEGNSSYFGLEIRAFSIEGSHPAPQFNIVCSPNAWANVIRADTTGLSPLEIEYKEFWDEVREYFLERKSPVSLRSSQPQSWTTAALGRAGFEIALAVNNRRGNGLACELYISHQNSAKALEELEAKKTDIEREFGETLSWQKLPKNCRIAAYKEAAFDDPKQREAIKEWFRTRAEKLYQVFSKRVKELQL